MESRTLLMLASTLIVFSLGLVHLVYTFKGPKLLPRDPAVVNAMKSASLVISNETTVWKAWIGFNASHSLAAMLFGIIYGYLAVVQPGILYGSWFLQVVGFAMLASLVVLAWQFWFSIPLIGVSLAFLFYFASILLALV